MCVFSVHIYKHIKRVHTYFNVETKHQKRVVYIVSCNQKRKYMRVNFSLDDIYNNTYVYIYFYIFTTQNTVLYKIFKL